MNPINYIEFCVSLYSRIKGHDYNTKFFAFQDKLQKGSSNASTFQSMQEYAHYITSRYLRLDEKFSSNLKRMSREEAKKLRRIAKSGFRGKDTYMHSYFRGKSGLAD